jgi:aspartate/tyrosine/aromatic aminotransferase
MFENTPTAPPDAIFGLAETFRDDPHPDKINLGIGVYRNEQGHTPVLRAVHLAEQRIWNTESTKSYLPIEGDRTYAEFVQLLLLGDNHPVLQEGRLTTAQTPGGTGAISIAADFLKRLRPDASAWVPDPTWANHKSIFSAVDTPVMTYPYLDSTGCRLAFEQLLEGLARVAPGDIVILHGCCHNPSGVDPDEEQWKAIGALLAEREALPLVDLAYQGFGNGLLEDRRPVEILCDQVPEFLICNSFSKNFSLYNERVGALTVLTTSGEAARAVLSQIRISIRVSYSNPPAHGASIVSTILGDSDLRELWQQELSEMRTRILEMRSLFVEGLDARGLELDQSTNQVYLEHHGMFSFTGLEPQQINELREKHGIYMLASSRINFAGLTSETVSPVCDAIASVVNA